MDNSNIEFYILVYITKSETFLLKIGEYLYTDDVREKSRRSYFDNRHCQTFFDLCYYVYNKTGKLASLNDVEFLIGRIFTDENQRRDILDIAKDVFQFDGEISWQLVEEESLKFVKDRKFIEALNNAQKDLEDKNYDSVIEKLQKSTLINFDSDYGVDIKNYSDVKNILEEINNSDDVMPTGYLTLDSEKVYNGGTRRKELIVIAANSGIGKTLFMNNLAVNFALSGKKVLFASFETSAARLTQRIMANLIGTTTTNISYNISEDEASIKKAWEENVKDIPGELRIKEFPSGTINSNQLTSFILDMKKNTGFEPDVVFADYLGIMVPTDKKLSKESLYAYDLAIAVDLRRMAQELNITVFTGAQINRDGLKDGATKTIITTEDLAESLGIEHTADSILTLSQDKNCQSKRQLICYVAKNRNAEKGRQMRLQLDDNCRLVEVKEQTKR